MGESAKNILSKSQLHRDSPEIGANIVTITIAGTHCVTRVTHKHLSTPTERRVRRRPSAERRSYYDFFGDLLLEVRGSGGRSTDQFRSMYGYFEVPVPVRSPDVVVEQTTDDLVLERAFGGPNDQYGWTGDRFVVRHGSEYMAVRPGWDHIWVTPNFEPYYATYPVEFRLRQKLATEGRALVHASGVERDGRAVVFPAWRSAGKTNTLLSLLREGDGFLADDRLWMGTDGTVRGYPLALNVHRRNVQSFPEVEVESAGIERRIRGWIDSHVQDRFGDGRSVPEKAISFLSEQFVASSGRDFVDVETLFPTTRYVEEAPVADVVLLSSAPNATSVSIQPITAREMSAAVAAIDHYEWNQRLGGYFRAYDALVEQGSAVDELTRVVEMEHQVLRDLFERVGTYRLEIPRESDWHSTGIDRAVVDLVTSVRDTSRTVP